MIKKIQLKLFLITTITILFMGCSDDNASLKNEQPLYAQFVESGVDIESVSYSSIPLSGDLKSDGTLEYLDGHTITLSIGDYTIGSILSVNNDGYIFLQDILGVDRESGLTNQGVANLARILLAINNNKISSNTNLIKALNNFDMKNKSEADVSTLIASYTLLDDVNQTYALNHVAYYYNLIKKVPIVDEVSKITTSLCLDINATTVNKLLSDENKLKKVDLYLDGTYQGTITKDVDLSRFPLHIGLNGASDIDKAKTYKITFKTDKTRNDTINYESMATTITLPSPMLGRWIDSQTQEIIYLKDESELTNYIFKDINQLKDKRVNGRYLLRSGIGNVNLFGTIQKLSTSNAMLGTIDMLIKNVESNISTQYKLQLSDVENIAGSVITNKDGLVILYVDGNTTQLRIPEILDVHIKDIQALSGKTEIYIRESSNSDSKISLFQFENIEDRSYDLGILNLTDETINYNLESKFKESNDYLYYGYDTKNFLDKPIIYTKTLQVCNNGSANISAAIFNVSHDNPALFKTFSADLSQLNAGFVSNTCQDIPLTFSFNKPTTITDATISLSVLSGSVTWRDHQRVRVSDETYVKLYFLSSDKELNSFIYIQDKGVMLSNIFEQNQNSFIKVPRYASIGYQLAVSSTNIDVENPFLIGTDIPPSPINWTNYVGTDDNELSNNTYFGGKISCSSPTVSLDSQTVALRYGEVVSYISYGDIDYFTLNQIPALLHKYSSFGTKSSISSSKNIVLPFYTKLTNANSSNIKLFDSNSNEISNLNITYSNANQTVTILDPLNKLSQGEYTIKVLPGLKSTSGESLTKNIEWIINIKKTSIVATGQKISFTLYDDANYSNGVSMVQIRDNENNTTTDINTKLIWQDDNNSNSLLVDYTQAKNYCKTLRNTASSSWRLPSRDELLTTVSYIDNTPSVDSAFAFTSAKGQYWTSTAVSGDDTSHWYIDFDNGESSFENEDLKNSVRCVVDSSDTNGTNFYIQSDYIRPASSEFVTDTNATYLLWQDDESVINSFDDAITYCQNLILEDENGLSYSEWRLPNIKELTTIIDDTVSGSFTPAIENKFTHTAANLYDRYWSSTTLNAESSKAWSISFEYGKNRPALKTDLNYVRCVSRGSK